MKHSSPVGTDITNTFRKIPSRTTLAMAPKTKMITGAPSYKNAKPLPDLRVLPFGDFARCVAELLTRMGYEDVRLAGRGAATKRYGAAGHDLVAFAAAPPPGPSDLLKTSGGNGPVNRARNQRKVVVLLKQFRRNDWVFQRMVDELRGVAIREGADEAILITTGRLSSVIAACEDRYDKESRAERREVLPVVHRIDGDRLCQLLAAYSVAIPRSGSSVAPDHFGNRAELFATTSDPKKGGARTESVRRRVRPPVPSLPSAQSSGPAPEPAGKAAEIFLTLRVTSAR